MTVWAALGSFNIYAILYHTHSYCINFWNTYKVKGANVVYMVFVQWEPIYYIINQGESNNNVNIRIRILQRTEMCPTESQEGTPVTDESHQCSQSLNFNLERILWFQQSNGDYHGHSHHSHCLNDSAIILDSNLNWLDCSQHALMIVYFCYVDFSSLMGPCLSVPYKNLQWAKELEFNRVFSPTLPFTFFFC